MFELGGKVKIENQVSETIGELVNFRIFDCTEKGILLQRSLFIWAVRWSDGPITLHREDELRSPHPRWLECSKRLECEPLKACRNSKISGLTVGNYLEGLCAGCKEK